MNNGNYPYGWTNTSNEFMMPQANDENDVREEIYKEYSLPFESFEDCFNRLAENIGDDFVYKLRRKSKNY